jgi:hypothetical protein
MFHLRLVVNFASNLQYYSGRLNINNFQYGYPPPLLHNCIALLSNKNNQILN